MWSDYPRAIKDDFRSLLLSRFRTIEHSNNWTFYLLLHLQNSNSFLLHLARRVKKKLQLFSIFCLFLIPRDCISLSLVSHNVESSRLLTSELNRTEQYKTDHIRTEHKRREHKRREHKRRGHKRRKHKRIEHERRYRTRKRITNSYCSPECVNLRRTKLNLRNLKLDQLKNKTKKALILSQASFHSKLGRHFDKIRYSTFQCSLLES